MMSISNETSCQTASAAGSGAVESVSGKQYILIQPTAKWIRVQVGGVTVADSKNVRILHERGHLPVYYFPKADVQWDLLREGSQHSHCPFKGDASYWDIVVGDRVIEQAAWSYLDPIPESEGIREYVAFYWNKVDKWLEEEEEVFVHPRDPYKHIDAIASSRHIQVVLNGVTVADSRRPVIVFETGLPVRYYLPKEDIKQELFTSSDLQTSCPYKGDASYLSAEVEGQVYDNIIWSYANPIPEIPKITGLYSFYNERVDAVYVDGVQEAAPQWHRSVLEFLDVQV